jgi:hypothetical protein
MKIEKFKKSKELRSNPHPKNFQINCTMSKLGPEVLFKKEKPHNIASKPTFRLFESKYFIQSIVKRAIVLLVGEMLL